MKNSTTTLAVKFWGTIETPPLQNREDFRRSVFETILKVLKLQDVTIEYIGYKPDRTGETQALSMHTFYEDCVFVSLSLHTVPMQQLDDLRERIINDFIKVFEDKTHKHLMVDTRDHGGFVNVDTIELISDWKYYLKIG